MVSGCTEIGHYKPKLSSSLVTKKWFICVHAYIYMHVHILRLCTSLKQLSHLSLLSGAPKAASLF